MQMPREGKALEHKDLTILIVEDLRPMRRIIRNTLRHFGFTTILEAQNGMEAIGILASTNVGLIISDWNMPEMSGLDLLKCVRSDKRTMDTPFIMVTAQAFEEPVTQAAEAKVNSYIVKPFKPDTLIKKLEEILPPDQSITRS